MYVYTVYIQYIYSIVTCYTLCMPQLYSVYNTVAAQSD